MSTSRLQGSQRTPASHPRCVGRPLKAARFGEWSVVISVGWRSCPQESRGNVPYAVPPLGGHFYWLANRDWRNATAGSDRRNIVDHSDTRGYRHRPNEKAVSGISAYETDWLS